MSIGKYVLKCFNSVDVSEVNYWDAYLNLEYASESDYWNPDWRIEFHSRKSNPLGRLSKDQKELYWYDLSNQSNEHSRRRERRIC